MGCVTIILRCDFEEILKPQDEGDKIPEYYVGDLRIIRDHNFFTVLLIRQ